MTVSRAISAGLTLTAALWCGIAGATPGFDPSAPAARFTGRETFTADGEIKLWSAIERLEDPDRTLLTPDEFGAAVRWPSNVDFAPWIRESFGTATPGAHQALLHMGPAEEVSSGTPILFVHGAGDNGSRSWVTMGTRMDRAWRPVYALTFAHPHGDVFKQAEQVANAIARIRHRTGAERVDLVAHSKGGIAAAVYLANATGVDWGNEAYEAVGTPYRGDVRRAVFIATPLDGIDTAYRWPSNNLASLDADAVLSPSSWTTHYPWSTSNLLVSTDLSAQDFLSDGGDLFPGQRQILRRQDHPLPGSDPTLGAYALQPDWYTTYEGGLGFQSWSEGIDAAIEDGGELISRLEARGVHPDVELFLLAGDNPLLSNGVDWVSEFFGDAYVDEIGSNVSAWSEFVGDLVGDGLIERGLTQPEVTGLAAGDLVLGEVSGPSDGVVFVSSATHGATLTARGARVVESKVVDLSHLDLLYASPITGQLLIDAAAEEGGEAWMAAFGARYVEADTLGWVERVLADPDVDTDTDTDTNVDPDTDPDTDSDTGPRTGGGLLQGCEGCQSGGTAPGGVLLLPLALAVWGRRRIGLPQARRPAAR